MGPSETLTVVTPSGRLRGAASGDVATFRGIRYAEAPTGRRRFRPPVPAAPWTGERDAFEFGASAPQPESMLAVFATTKDEDCLFLNVVAPTPDGAPPSVDDRRPVMVWVHGGSFTTGSAAINWYDGERLARRGAVVVTLNYRLGPLGFLHLAALGGEQWTGSANLGLLDQALAFDWVRSHIAAFGGDPDNVTIFGESAGGMSVATQLALPASRGRFRRAIAQSGAARHVHPAEVGERVARAVLDQVGVDPGHLERLADVPTEAIIDAVGRIDTGDGAELPLPFAPTVDGESLPEPPEVAVASGVAAGIDLLVGTTSEEMRLFHLGPRIAGETMDEPRLLRIVGRALAHHEVAADPAEVVATYRRRLAEAEPADVWMAISTDLVFAVPAMALASAQHRHAPTRTYLFTHPSTAFGGALGAGHAMEIPFVFDNLHQKNVDVMLGEITEARRELAARMADAWVGFATDGRPAGALADWPIYDPYRRATMVLDEECEVVDAPHDAERPDLDGLTVREWFVAGGIVETDEGVLLVRNVRRNGSSDWTPPGGVIEVEEGETVLDGLTREVEEETGLRVLDWAGPCYRIEATAPDLGWQLRVEVYRGLTHEGELRVGDDPDGIVVEAAFVRPDACHEPLATTHPWVREPLSEWLTERWEETRGFEYHVEGATLGSLVITRL